MRPRGSFGGRNLRLGRFRVPFVVGLLIAVTLVLSIAAAVLGRNGVPVLKYGVLLAPEVWQGQLWRLFTWQFFELDPIGLLFACLLLYWFGRDLCDHWGPRKFLAVYFGFAGAVGAVLCLVGRFVSDAVYAMPYYGTWPIAEALTVAWATLFPDREIFIFFVIRAGGRMLIALTLGLTVLVAAFSGMVPMLPHLLAAIMMLLYMGQLRRVYLTWRLSRLQNQKKRARAYVDNVIRLDRQEPEDPDSPAGKPPKYLN